MFAVDRNRGRHGDKGEFVGFPIANLQIVRSAAFDPCRHFDRDDEVAAAKHGVAFRRVVGQAMEIHKRYRPFPRQSPHVNDRVERRERHREVGGMGRDTSIRPAEDRVVAIETMTRRASRAWAPLVARGSVVIAEIGAARTLHQVAAD